MADQGHRIEKRRVTLTQLLRVPVLNPAGVEIGKLEDLVVKLAATEPYPPVTGLVARVGAQALFIGADLIDELSPAGIRITSHTLRTEPFERRPGEVLLAGDVLGRHLVDMAHGRIVRAHDLVLSRSASGWQLAGVDRSPQAMLRRLVPRRRRPDLRRHSVLDWRDIQPFVRHVPTAHLLMPLQRLRRLHPAQIADIVEGASHEEGEEIIESVENDAELTADVFEELDDHHRMEFLESRSNSDIASLLDRMAPDDAADLLGDLSQERRKPVFDLMSPVRQHKLRQLLQFHPSTAGGTMTPDYVSIVRGATVAAALDAIRADDKAPPPLLNVVFVVDDAGRFVGSVAAGSLVRARAGSSVDELELNTCYVHGEADFSDVTLLIADYNLSALAVVDAAGVLIGAISSDDVIEALVPDDWRARVEASAGV